ncbi:hypothetical protein BDQ17DRAFT_1416701 [Cyathus striatus]|nr:hypothetical protein BDQ17DRAFT_1416701 [Cyathus striatus]
MKALHSRHVEIAERDFENALFTGSGILENNVIELLASVDPIDTIEKLKSVIEKLLTRLQTLYMVPMRPKPCKVNAAKRLYGQSAGAISRQTYEQMLTQIRHFLKTLETPIFESAQKKRRFLAKATEFYIRDGKMYKVASLP